MSEFIAVDGEQVVYFFPTDKDFYDFVNEVEETDEDEKENYVFLDKFPTPKDKSLGAYCPFDEETWPSNALFVLKDGVPFIPNKRLVEKTIRITEYCNPTSMVPAPRRRQAAKKAAPRTRRR